MTEVGHEAEAIECHKVEETSHSEWDALDELLVDKRLFVPVKYVRTVAYILSIDH